MIELDPIDHIEKSDEENMSKKEIQDY